MARQAAEVEIGLDEEVARMEAEWEASLRALGVPVPPIGAWEPERRVRPRWLALLLRPLAVTRRPVLWLLRRIEAGCDARFRARYRAEMRRLEAIADRYEIPPLDAGTRAWLRAMGARAGTGVPLPDSEPLAARPRWLAFFFRLLRA